jgi:hypothetical protein
MDHFYSIEVMRGIIMKRRFSRHSCYSLLQKSCSRIGYNLVVTNGKIALRERHSFRDVTTRDMTMMSRARLEKLGCNVHHFIKKTHTHSGILSKCVPIDTHCPAAACVRASRSSATPPLQRVPACARSGGREHSRNSAVMPRFSGKQKKACVYDQ